VSSDLEHRRRKHYARTRRLSEDSVVSSIKAECPTCRVLMLTSYTDPVILSEALDGGCDEFVTKRNGASEILSAVLAVASDETPVSADMVRSLVRRDYVGVGVGPART
jgi:DNA-binding NarL/FixJ family response regulator